MDRSTMNRRAFLCSITAAYASGAEPAGSWPTWRGPSFDGIAEGTGPLSWSDDSGVRWRLPIPGRGFSTPVIHGNRIFVTTAIPLAPRVERPAPPHHETPTGPNRRAGEDGPKGGGKRGPKKGPKKGPQGREVDHEFALICIERESGRVAWRDTVARVTPHESYRPTDGSHCNQSPVTDGVHVWTWFGSRGVFCHDIAGKRVWSRDLGVKLRIYHEYGEGTSPVLDGGLLYLKADHEAGSFLIALDAETGATVWRADRDEPTSYSCPLPVTDDGRRQLIATGSNRVRSYDARTGAVIWECGGLGMNAIPTPVAGGGLVFAMTGYQNPMLLAIRLGGRGDISDSNRVAWRNSRGNSYVPSPLYWRGKLFVLADGGFLSCYDARTGKPHYQQWRIGTGNLFKASPVMAGGRLYLAGENENVFVASTDETPRILATNKLADQRFVASPAIAGGELYLRSESELFRISSNRR